MVSRFRFRVLPDESYGWMLLGGNNRLIGVPITGEVALARAVSSAERVQRTVDVATFTFFVGEDRLWHWGMYDDGLTLAQSPSGFARRLDADRAARRFRRAAVGAEIESGLVTVPHRVRDRPGLSREDPGIAPAAGPSWP